MKKDVREEIKLIKTVAFDRDIRVIEGNHLKVHWKMLDNTGKLKTIRIVLGRTPSCCHWIKNHRRNVIREMRKNDICPKEYTENQ